jgi:catechol 2,3-dioxygenase-like lactoylglutathione lyase family enzyme
VGNSAFAGTGPTSLDSSGMLCPYLVGLIVADISKSADWYHEHLGFEIAKTMDFPELDSLRIVFLKRDASELELVQKRSSISIKKYVPDYDQNASPVQGITKVAFWVHDVSALADTLRMRGIKILYGPFNDETFKLRSMIIEDLDGNLLQFSQPLGPTMLRK